MEDDGLIDIVAEVTAQEIETVLASIPAGEEPETSIGLTSATATFSNGVRSEATFVPDFLAGTATITSAAVFASDGTRILTAPDVGVAIDLDGNILNPEAIQGFDVTLVDAPDRLDADAFLALVSTIQSAFADIPVAENLDGIRVAFGAEPDAPADPYDTANYDTLEYDVARADIEQTENADGSVSLSSADGTAEVTGLERLELTDGTFLYGIEHDRTEFVYGLYAASLDRTPDEAGFVFWNEAARDPEQFSDEDLANFFVESPEFATLFDEDIADRDFINQLYTVVLDREADDPGFDFWLDAFGTGLFTRAGMLNFFVDSPENLGRIEADVSDGYWVVDGDAMM